MVPSTGRVAARREVVGGERDSDRPDGELPTEGVGVCWGTIGTAFEVRLAGGAGSALGSRANAAGEQQGQNWPPARRRSPGRPVRRHCRQLANVPDLMVSGRSVRAEQPTARRLFVAVLFADMLWGSVQKEQKKRRQDPLLSVGHAPASAQGRFRGGTCLCC